MISDQAGQHVADLAAVAAPLVALGATLADLHEIAQIFAFIGSGLGGIGAFIYYVWHKRKK